MSLLSLLTSHAGYLWIQSQTSINRPLHWFHFTGRMSSPPLHCLPGQRPMPVEIMATEKFPVQQITPIRLVTRIRHLLPRLPTLPARPPASLRLRRPLALQTRAGMYHRANVNDYYLITEKYAKVLQWITFACNCLLSIKTCCSGYKTPASTSCILHATRM